VSLEAALVRARLARRYSEKLLRALVETENPTVGKVEALLLLVDDVAIEVETVRSELRAIHPDHMP
jgi:hypothetical protein